MLNLERYYGSHIVSIRHRHKKSGKTKESLHSALICLSHLSCVKPWLHGASITMTAMLDIKLAKLYIIIAWSCLHHYDGNRWYHASKNIYQMPSKLQILLSVIVGSCSSQKKANKLNWKVKKTKNKNKNLKIFPSICWFYDLYVADWSHQQGIYI
jgi:hypothetical protein